MIHPRAAVRISYRFLLFVHPALLSCATGSAPAVPLEPPAADHAETESGKPEDVFKGKIIVTPVQMPSHYESGTAFIKALRDSATDEIGIVDGSQARGRRTWKVEYIAFFADPLAVNPIEVELYDVTTTEARFVARDAQFTRELGSRIFSASIGLSEPQFHADARYRLTFGSRGAIIASTTFMLLDRPASLPNGASSN